MPEFKRQSEKSIAQNIIKGLTVRKLVLVLVVVILLKAAWTLLGRAQKIKLKTVPSGKLKTVSSGMQNYVMDEVMYEECIYKDGKCEPLEEEEVALSRGLDARGNSFYLKGRPFKIFSGSFHYFRTIPSQWDDRLLKMKAAGLNTVMTYVPWNLHEPKRGQYTFDGYWNLVSFIKQVQNVGLHLIVRPGPYICAEWEYGGLPSWLLSDPDLVIRNSTSKSKTYVESVEKYFSKLLPLLAGFQYQQGGPIIAFQVENEFGSYSSDTDHLEFLVKLFRDSGLNELFFTSDGKKQLPKGKIPGVLSTVNFGEHPVEALQALKNFQPNKPLMVTEFWCGWFDHWNDSHNIKELSEFREILETILRLNASVNFYMFVGGTNFELWNGANFIEDRPYPIAPTVTSYDYDAPIAENGDVKPKLEIIRELLKKYSLYPLDLPPIPPNLPSASYGKLKVTEMMTFDHLIDLVPEKNFKFESPRYMEYLPINNNGGQGYGWILYRSHFPRTNSLKIQGILRDYVQVFVNGKRKAVITSWEPLHDVTITLNSSSLSDNNSLDIMVENLGRVNFKLHLNEQRKGFEGSVQTAEGLLIGPFIHVPLEICDVFLKSVQNSKAWEALVRTPRRELPTAYRTKMYINTQPQDTFLDMWTWDKGVVAVNGFLLGRYWKVGPQQTLYVPAPLLHVGANDIIIFEMGSNVTEYVVPSKHSPWLG